MELNGDETQRNEESLRSGMGGGGETPEGEAHIEIFNLAAAS